MRKFIITSAALLILTCGAVTTRTKGLVGKRLPRTNGNVRNSTSMPHHAANESVHDELVRIQRQQGLTLASFYERIYVTVFADRAQRQFHDFAVSDAVLGALSRDGTEVAFDVFDGTHLGVARFDGSDLRMFPNLLAPHDICWSYDKSEIVMSVQHAATESRRFYTSLEILNLESRIVREIGPPGASVTTQCWSPDGKRIVYSADEKIWILDVHQNTSRALVHGAQPTWSPDGSRIAYVKNDIYYQIDPSGDQQEMLLLKSKGALSGFWWSPDSRFGAYISRAGFFEGSWKIMDVGLVRLRVIRLADGSQDWVTELSDAYVPQYQWIANPELLPQRAD